MSSKLELVKETKKSDIYENDSYRVKISEIDGFFWKKNGDKHVPYDFDLEDGKGRFVEAVKLEITNKKTGKKSQKRCFQGFGQVLDDVQYDIDHDKSQFKSIFKKID